jgi:hypothetical protein
MNDELSEDLARLAQVVRDALAAAGVFDGVEVRESDEGPMVVFYDDDFGHEVALVLEPI